MRQLRTILHHGLGQYIRTQTPLCRHLSVPFSTQNLYKNETETLLSQWYLKPFPWDDDVATCAQSILPFKCGEQPDIKPLQRIAINAQMKRQHVLLQLPTGAGKSLCYQIPAALSHGVTVVISPLIALIQDQRASLQQAGFPCAEFHSAVPLSDQKSLLNKLASSNNETLDVTQQSLKFLFVTPEALTTNQLLRVAMERLPVSRFVFDECHLIMEWGNSFRPAYVEVCRVIQNNFPDVPFTLMTATATEEISQNILDTFDVSRADQAALSLMNKSNSDINNSTRVVVVKELYDRRNLHLEVRRVTQAVFNTNNNAPKSKFVVDLATFLNELPSIVYTMTQSESEKLATALAKVGCNAACYHGGMSAEKRSGVQKRWQSGKLSVIVATVAFGMGVNRRDVRRIVHSSLPYSLSAYYQQIGRAGRDGEESRCRLYFHEDDVHRVKFVLSGGDNCVTTRDMDGIEYMRSFCDNSHECRREVLYGALGGTFHVENCAKNCNCHESTDSNDYDFDPGENTVVLQHNGKSKSMEKRAAASRSRAVYREKTSTSVEFVHQRVINIAKQRARKEGRAFKKQSDTLSRRVVQDIIEVYQPSSKAELAALKGVGNHRAEMFYDELKVHYVVEHE